MKNEKVSIDDIEFVVEVSTLWEECKDDFVKQWAYELFLEFTESEEWVKIKDIMLSMPE
ncbi:hypothetical protein [Candidatus Uabimicrobium amorphum]|uniref:Uncharacterized protein n=1 Tax=Uabimicrobium amorphum TaxID=2596890 RepID=A0A5S9IR00_UABAM|nr:hypothetical protein [Candidatus Uabimicrobium amorphum]BBM85852.1 hypothetical protein UABAM_04230 [Candidatus Uabimicrobium amorphum]